MRTLLSISLGIFMVVVAAPSLAGTLPDYSAKPGVYKVENGIRVFRILSTPTRPVQNEYERAFDTGYNQGFGQGYDKGFETASQDIRSSQKQKKKRSSRNYGRRYSTSFQSPNHSRFRLNASFGRPAYINITKIKK